MKNEEVRKKYTSITGFLMLLLDLSLIIPVYALVRGLQSYGRDLIEAIAVAAYTTVKVTLAVSHVLKARKTNDVLIMRLRALTLMEALFSILILQNTLIMTINGSIKGGMRIVSSASSTVILLLIVLISAASFFGAKKKDS